jgi:hypothetical protein
MVAALKSDHLGYTDGETAASSFPRGLFVSIRSAASHYFQRGCWAKEEDVSLPIFLR